VKQPISVVHDATGQIVAVARSANPARLVVVPANGQFILAAEGDEKSAGLLASHRVDVQKHTLVRNTK